MSPWLSGIVAAVAVAAVIVLSAVVVGSRSERQLPGSETEPRP